MLFVDAGNNSIGINNSTPGSYDAGADDLVVGDHSVSSQGITIASDDNSILYFADGTSGDEKYRGSIIYNHPADNFIIRTAGFNTRMTIDSTGAVTIPNQPAFLASPASNQNDISINSAVDVVFGTEVYDQNGDFASNTFTAPVTGKYQFNITIYMSDFDASADYLQIDLDTSNRDYHTIMETTDEDGYMGMTIAALADMDANDTAKVVFYQGSGAAQVNITTGSRFSGFLAC